MLGLSKKEDLWIWCRGDNHRFSDNFESWEFECGDLESPCDCLIHIIDTRLIDRLECLRDDLRRPIHISSGYRCIAHNGLVRGAKNSRHLYGLAADIAVHTLTGAFLHAAADGFFKRFGIGSGYLHVDIDDENEATWTY